MEQINLLSLEQLYLQSLQSEGKSLNTLKNYKTDLDCFNQFLLGRQNDLSFSDFGMKKVTCQDDVISYTIMIFTSSSTIQTTKNYFC